MTASGRSLVSVSTIELTERRDCLVESWRRTAAHSAPAVGLGKQEHVEKVGMRLEPLAGAVAEAAIGVGSRHRKLLDEPRRAGRDQAVEGCESGHNGVSPIDGETHVVTERGREELLVTRTFLANRIKYLEGVFEGVTFGMPCRILSHGFEHRDESRQPIEPIAEDGGQRTGRVESAVDLAADFGVARQTIVWHPFTGDPPGRAEDCPPRVGATRHLVGSFPGDSLPQPVLCGGCGVVISGGRLICLVGRHWAAASARGRQRMPRISAVVE